MDQKITVVGQHPFRLVIALDAERQLARLFEPELHFVTDGLNLARIVPRADDEVVSERRDPGQI